MDELRQNELLHQLTLKECELMHISGVTDVESFDEETVKLVTTCGKLTVSGSGLHVSELQLETGDVRLSGRVDSLVYTVHEPHRSLLRRIFR